ncbi:hypothetical protein MBLNU230_g0722t1 [Neophaeotheca triangularis]
MPSNSILSTAFLALLTLPSLPVPVLADFPKNFASFTVSRLPVPGDKSPPADLKVVDNVIGLKRGKGKGTTPSAEIVEAMRRGKDLRGIYNRVAYAEAPLISVQAGSIFLAEATIGGNEYSFVVDTGSSDPWVVRNDFTCLDVTNDAELDPELCYFGPTYDPTLSPTYRPFPDHNFNISYAAGERLNGIMGYEEFTMAGITVPNQAFGIVDQAAWYGDDVSSGLIGLAYRALTNAYPAANPFRTGASLYNPLFTNMYELGLTAPIFSLAISRDESEGGILALGGIPSIPHSSTFIPTPIVPVGINASDGTLVYEFYTITIDGFAYSRNRFESFNPTSVPNARQRSVVGNNTAVIVDSGTTLLYAPDDIAEEIIALFDPPGYFDSDYDIWFVDCDSRPPNFGVMIGGKVFYVNPLDLILQIGPGQCISGVQPSFGGYVILGDVWMKNVLAVFDLGAQELRVAARRNYPLAWPSGT